MSAGCPDVLFTFMASACNGVLVLSSLEWVAPNPQQLRAVRAAKMMYFSSVHLPKLSDGGSGGPWGD